jgi:hypothetical protein
MKDVQIIDIADLEQENILLRARNDCLEARKPLVGALIRNLYAKYPDPIEFCRAIEKEHQIG